MRVFYATGLWYEPGEIVQPGSWGRVVLGAGSAHSWFAPEMLLEHVRDQEFPESASRLHSLIVSDSAETARRWLDNSRRHIYELEIDAEPTVVDVGWLNRVVLNHTIAGGVVTHSVAEVQQCVRSYWGGETCPDGLPTEHLVPGPGVVKSRLT